MEPVSGVWGYVLFWGLTALAAGIFFQRFCQITKLISLGRDGGQAGAHDEAIVDGDRSFYHPVLPV